MTTLTTDSPLSLTGCQKGFLGVAGAEVRSAQGGVNVPPVVVNGNVPPSSPIKQVLQRVSQSSGFSKLS